MDDLPEQRAIITCITFWTDYRTTCSRKGKRPFPVSDEVLSFQFFFCILTSSMFNKKMNYRQDTGRQRKNY